MKKVIAFASAVAILGFASTASAFLGGSDIEVNNDNNAHVQNVVTTSSNTGGNVSVGGAATLKVKGWGNGSNSSTAGNGGAIDTGDSSSWSYVDNTVNVNKTKVSTPCGCKGDVEVKNKNNAGVYNTVGTLSDTGSNTTVGGESYARVRGINNDGNSARGGAASSIKTGDAGSQTDVINVVNKNITRVRKTGSN